MEYLLAALAVVVVIAIFVRRNSEDISFNIPEAHDIEARRDGDDSVTPVSVPQDVARPQPWRPLDGPAYVETDEDIARRSALNRERNSPSRRIVQTTQPSSTRARRRKKAAELPEMFVVVDLETTGLSARVDEIIEIGAIRVQRGAESHKTFQILVKPERPIPRRITELTGITQAMVHDAGAPLNLALVQFMEFVGDLPLVAYNAPFDMGFLAAASQKCGLEIKNEYMCALEAARQAWPDLPSHRLSDMAEFANLPMNDLHRSLGDCMRTVHIYAAAVSKIASS